MFIGNPEEKSYRSIFPVATEEQLMRRHHHNTLATNGAQFLFLTRWRRVSSGITVQPATRRCVQSGVRSYCLRTRWASSPLLPPPSLAGSSLAAAGWQTVVQRIAERLGGLQDLRAAWGEGFLRPLPEQLQSGLPAHLGDAGSAILSPAAKPRLGRDGQAAWVSRPAGGGTAGLHALKGCTEVGNILGHVFHLM